MTAATLANLTDDQARQLDDQARDFYFRVLILMNETGCSAEMAYRAVELAATTDDTPMYDDECGSNSYPPGMF